MARLIVESGSDAGMVYQLNYEPVTIGRSASSTVQVIDKRVSRHHAMLKEHRDGHVAEDLGSKNGTFINNHPLIGRVKLAHGDKLVFGDTVLLYETEPHREDASSSSTNVHLAVVDMGPHTSELSVTPPLGVLAAPGTPEIRKSLSDPIERLKVVYQVADSIRSELDIDELLPKIMENLWQVVAPDRGIILIRDEGTCQLEPVVVRVRDDIARDITISRGIVERSMQDRVAILVSDAPSDLRFSANESVMAGKIRSAICSPLVHKNDVLGVIYVDLQDAGSFHFFTNDELDLVTGIANQAATAIVNARLMRQALARQRMEKELEIARDIQTNLLPREYPKLAGFEFAAMSQPARQVGGDYYDFIPMIDDRLGIVIADISGKGVPAAILTASIRASLRIEAMHNISHSVAEIVQAVNEWTCCDTTSNMFATMVFMSLDSSTAQVSYTNAGHTFPLLFRGDDTVLQLDTGGCFLGIMDVVDYESAVLQLLPGDILLLYTDGITDAHNTNNELFAIERLTSIVKSNRHLCAQELRDEIYEATLEFRGRREQFDDLTMIVIKVHEKPMEKNLSLE